MFLIADMNIRCYDSTHNSWLFLFFLLLILYIIGIPVGLNALVQSEGELFGSLGMRYRVGISSKDTTSRARGGGSRSSSPRKFLLVTFVVLSATRPGWAATSSSGSSRRASCLHLVANPYANERKHRLESYGLLASIITFNCGILYREDYGDYVNTAVTLVLFATHIGMSLLLGKSMYEEFAAEGRNALIARAQHDIMLEEKIANEFEKRKASRAEMEREEEKQAKLNATIGAHLPFADDALLQQVETGTALEIKTEHKRLSRGSRDCARRGGNDERRTRRRSIGWTKRTWQGSSPLWSAGANAVPRNRASQLRRETKTKASRCRGGREWPNARERRRGRRENRDDSFLES